MASIPCGKGLDDDANEKDEGSTRDATAKVGSLGSLPRARGLGSPPPSLRRSGPLPSLSLGHRAIGRQGGPKSRISTTAIFQNNGKRIKELKASTLNLHHMGGQIYSD